MTASIHFLTWPLGIFIATLVILIRPAYANGGHVHLGGIFFLLLGGIVFIGGIVVIFYLLLRAEPEESDAEASQEELYDDE